VIFVPALKYDETNVILTRTCPPQDVAQKSTCPPSIAHGTHGPRQPDNRLRSFHVRTTIAGARHGGRHGLAFELPFQFVNGQRYRAFQSDARQLETIVAIGSTRDGQVASHVEQFVWSNETVNQQVRGRLGVERFRRVNEKRRVSARLVANGSSA
jgi:hypothetical protein